MRRDMSVILACGFLAMSGMGATAAAEDHLYINQGIFVNTFPITRNADHKEAYPDTPLVTIRGGDQVAAKTVRIRKQGNKILLVDTSDEVPREAPETPADSSPAIVRITGDHPVLADQQVQENTAAMTMMEVHEGSETQASVASSGCDDCRR